MSERLGVGVVGCGDIAQAVYLPGLSALQGEGALALVAVCDQDTSRLTETAQRYPTAAAYDALDAMLADPRVDILVNLTPIPAHAACTMRGLEAHKHVYSEKPIATSISEADAIIAAAHEQRLTLVCAPVIILHPEVQRAIAWIKKGAIGKVASARARASHAGPARLYDFTTDPTWFYKRGGGPLFDLAVYPIQILCAMLGPVRRVSAFAGISSPNLVVRSGIAAGKEITVETPDNIPILLDFGDTTFATVDASYVVLSAKGPRMELYGDRGTLNLYSRPEDPEYELYIDNPETDVRGWLQYEHSYRGSLMPHLGSGERPSWSFVEGIRHLVECIQYGSPPVPSGELARHVLEIVNAAIQSAEAGRVVELETSFAMPAQQGAH